MIVEFISVPGAGKTTLMPIVNDHFEERCLNAYSVLEAARPFAARTSLGKIVCLLPPGRIQRFLLWQVFYASSFLYRARFSKKHPALMQMVLIFQKQRPISKADRKHVLRWFMHLTGSYEFLKARARDDDMLIFDEGFVHRVVQLFASENETPDVARVAAYLDLIPKPDLVIFPRASYEVCEKRVFERGVWQRFQVKKPEDTGQFIKNAHLIVNFAVKHIKEKGWPVVEVDNDIEPLAVSMTALRRNLSDIENYLPVKAYL